MERTREFISRSINTCAREAVEARQASGVEQPQTKRKQPRKVQAITAPAAPLSRAKQLFQAQNHPKKFRKLGVLDQWVEVEIQDGKTVTKLYPSNAGLIKEGQAMDPPPELVYRRLNFPHGIPQEYRWVAASHPERFERGGCGVQRMTVDRWLELIELEEANGTGHVGPTGVGNLPRPRERGECECEVCSHNREVMERRAEGE